MDPMLDDPGATEAGNQRTTLRAPACIRQTLPTTCLTAAGDALPRRVAETQVSSSAAASSERCSAPMSDPASPRSVLVSYDSRTCSRVVQHLIEQLHRTYHPITAASTSDEPSKETVAAVHRTIE